MLLLLVLVGVAASVFVVNMTGNMARTAERANLDALALAQAKQALIGYVSVVRTTRPGAFPCPDTDNDGNADAPYSGNDCPGYVAGSNVYLGRLPWQTLGLPDLRDSSGERLWYAVDRNFALNPSCLPNCPNLTSDTLGQLTVTGTAPGSGVVAIIFAPGKAQGSQVRDGANLNTAANYLDGENANNNTTFATAVATDTFNDRLLTVTNPDFMPEIEKYVARAILVLLQQYKAAVGKYPWADISDGNSNVGYNRWRMPCGTASPTNWGSGGAPALPQWLTNGCGSPPTGWTGVIYYAVSKDQLPSGCITCTSGHVRVDGNNVDLVLLTPGGYASAPTRNWPLFIGNITGYFEDSTNTDNTDDFVTPSKSNYPHPLNHDRIFTL